MSTRDRLTSRPDIDNDDIPWIIDRADAMQAASRSSEDEHATVEEVVAVGEELDIDEEFVEKAIEELRKQRASASRSSSNRTLWFGMVSGFALLVAGGVWLSTTPFPQTPVPPPVDVQPRTPVTSGGAGVKTEPPAPKPPVVPESTDVPVEPKPPEAPVEAEPPEVPAEPEPPDVPAKPEPPDVPAEPNSVVSEKTARPPEPAAPPPSDSPAPRELVRAVQGDWVLVSYHMLKDDASVEVAVSDSTKYETRERWRLRDDGTFLHIMGEISFSGRYSLSIPGDRPLPLMLNESTSFLLTATDVYANIPGIERPQEYFIGELRGERMVLFYLGKERNAKRLPKQAHGFRKSWKGGWTW